MPLWQYSFTSNRITEYAGRCVLLQLLISSIHTLTTFELDSNTKVAEWHEPGP